MMRLAARDTTAEDLWSQFASLTLGAVLSSAGKNDVGGDKGELLIEGDTGKVHSKSGIRAFVGIAPDMFAADAVAVRCAVMF